MTDGQSSNLAESLVANVARVFSSRCSKLFAKRGIIAVRRGSVRYS